MASTAQQDTQVRSGEVLDSATMARRWAGKQFEPLINGTSPMLGFALVGAGFIAFVIFLGLGWLLGLSAGSYLTYLGLRQYRRTRLVNPWLVGSGALVILASIVHALGLTLPILAAALFVAGGVLLFRQYRSRVRIVSPIVRSK